MVVFNVGGVFMDANLKLLKFTIDDPIAARLNGLKDLLEQTNDDYGYDLIKLCLDYFAIYEPAEHINECEMCMRQALFHWINYCLENNIPLPISDELINK